MPNGSPGDDPIIDVISQGLTVYGKPIDTQLRELSKLLSLTSRFLKLVRWLLPLSIHFTRKPEEHIKKH
jgi:hypothetical protein